MATGGARFPSQEPSSERPKRKSKRMRRSVKAGEETSTKAAGRRISEDDEETTKKKMEEDEEVVSSAPSSPLREPRFPRLAAGDLDHRPELIEAWELAHRDYQTKRGNLYNWFSPPELISPLDSSINPSSSRRPPWGVGHARILPTFAHVFRSGAFPCR